MQPRRSPSTARSSTSSLMESIFVAPEKAKCLTWPIRGATAGAEYGCSGGAAVAAVLRAR